MRESGYFLFTHTSLSFALCHAGIELSRTFTPTDIYNAFKRNTCFPRTPRSIVMRFPFLSSPSFFPAPISRLVPSWQHPRYRTIMSHNLADMMKIKSYSSLGRDSQLIRFKVICAVKRKKLTRHAKFSLALS